MRGALMKFGIILFVVFISFHVSCFATVETFDALSQKTVKKKLDELAVKLECPQIQTVFKLSDSFYKKSLTVKRTQKALLSLLIGSGLAGGGYLIYKYCRPDQEGEAASGGEPEKKKKKIPTKCDLRVASGRLTDYRKIRIKDKIQKRKDKRSVKYLARKALDNGIFIGLGSVLVGIILGIYSSTCNFTKEQIMNFWEMGELKHTFLNLKENLICNLDWTADSLNDLVQDGEGNVDNLMSFCGIIDNNFILVRSLELFLALILAKAKIKFGANSEEYRKILMGETEVLALTEHFTNCLQKDLNGGCKIKNYGVNDDTVKYLKILSSRILKLAHLAQQLLYG